VNTVFLGVYLRAHTTRIYFHKWHLKLLRHDLLDWQIDNFLGVVVAVLFATDLQKLNLRGQPLLGQLVALAQLLKILVADGGNEFRVRFALGITLRGWNRHLKLLRLMVELVLMGNRNLLG